MKHDSPYVQHLGGSVALFSLVILIVACRLNTFQAQTSPTLVASATVAIVLTREPSPELVALTATTEPAAVSPSLLATPTSLTNTLIISQPEQAKAGHDSITSTSVLTMEVPPPATTTLSSSGINVYETTLTLPTYPFKDYLVEQIDPIYNLSAFYFRRSDYEAAAPGPVPTAYTGIVLENDYLRLTFLPELGGRLYSAVVKATDQEIFYHNSVVKPSRYGVLQPAEANWWLATGGMEWAYPTQEHGYRYGIPWQYKITQSADSATITLSDTAAGRAGAEVSVTLASDSALFTVNPRLINAGPNAVPVQFWLNAALSLSPGAMSPQTQFIVPTDKIIIHSRGEPGWTVPDAQSEAPWPLVGQTDLRDYSQWVNYLGFFIPYIEAPFMGAYNPETNLGVVRLIEPGQVPGSKLFAFGGNFPDRSYTDDNSQYFEIWGGLNTGFWSEADVLVSSGDELEWQESWWPLAGLGGVTWANQHLAIHLSQADDAFVLSALVSRSGQGKVTVWAGESPLLTESFSANPAVPLQWSFANPNKPVKVQFVDSSGTELLSYQFDQDNTSNE